MKKILWCTSFRSFYKSKKNDSIQNYFISSIESIDNYKIKLITTQFSELNVEERLKKSNIDYIYCRNSISLPDDVKYSQSIIFNNAVNEYILNDYDYLIWSTCDFLFSDKFIDRILESYHNNNNFMACIIPQNSVSENCTSKIFSFDYGIDFFLFKVSDPDKKEKLKKYVQEYQNYNWGAYEHFLCSMKDLLNINAYNAFKKTNLLKFENDREVFLETRKGQVEEWVNNAHRLTEFYKLKKINSLYIKGSMIYLFFKMTRLRDINLKLLIKTLVLISKIISSKFKKYLWY